MLVKLLPANRGCATEKAITEAVQCTTNKKASTDSTEVEATNKKQLQRPMQPEKQLQRPMQPEKQLQKPKQPEKQLLRPMQQKK